MSKNRRILKIGIIIILITFILSLATSYFLRLDKPVFLQSYVELQLPVLENGDYGSDQFEIRYITNTNDNRVVNNIEFIDLPGLYAYVYDTEISGLTEGMYSIRSVNVFVDGYQIQGPIQEMHLNKAKVYFTDGSAEIIDIGDIVLFDSREGYEYFEFVSGSGSSDGIESTLSEVKEDITLLKVDSPLLRNIEEYIEIQIDGVDYKEIEGIKYSKGDSIKTRAVIDEINDPLLKYNSYFIRPKLYFMDNEGKPIDYPFDGFYIREYSFELIDIIKYLRARGEI